MNCYCCGRPSKYTVLIGKAENVRGYCLCENCIDQYSYAQKELGKPEKEKRRNDKCRQTAEFRPLRGAKGDKNLL